ncbi:MAG: hypothetical protein ACSHXL_02020 [Bacteroidota bacterium]
MIRRFSLVLTVLILFSSLLFSCREDGKRKLFGLKKVTPPTLIHNHLLFSTFANEFSFPIWFNDSLIAMNKVAKITRNIYPKSLSSVDQEDSMYQVPSEIITYEFNKLGMVKKVSHVFYYDDRKISQFEYVYPFPANKNGFASVRLDSMVLFKDNISIPLNTTRDMELFALYNTVKSGPGFSIFNNRMSGDNLFCISDKKLSSPLEIDRQFKPNPRDLILLGTPRKPEKVYHVENKINEIHVKKFNYDKNKIVSIRSNSYPFHTTRYFSYDKKGYCTGFIDSTYSESTFLTRTISNFDNNALHTPTKIFHRKENSEGVMRLINYEEFIYEYRK